MVLSVKTIERQPQYKDAIGTIFWQVLRIYDSINVRSNKLLHIRIHYCVFKLLLFFSFNKYNLNIVAAFSISWYEQLSCDQKGINEEILEVRF